MKRATYFIFLIIGLQIASLCAAEKENKDFAIAVVAYNRPDYLKEVVEAIRSNPESETTPIYFFLDGGPEATQEKNVEVAKSFGFPEAHFVLREKNFGCPKNLIDARRYLFDKKEYEKILIIEDDNMISSNYIAFILNFYSWAKKHMNGVGAVCGWNQVLLTLEEKRKDLNMIVPNSKWNYWAYVIDRECWDAIKGTYYEYERLFLSQGGRSHYANADKIRTWIRRKVVMSDRYGDSYADWLLRGDYGTGQDAVMRLALWEQGLQCSCSQVNRLINIGKIGINFNETFWEKELKGYVLDLFEEDASIVDFEILDAS